MMFKVTALFFTVIFYCTVAVANEASVESSYDVVNISGSLESLGSSSLLDVEISFRVFFDELFKQDGLRSNVKIYDTDQQVIESIEKGTSDLVFINTKAFIGNEALFHPTARYAIQYNEQLKSHYVVMVRRQDSHLDLVGFKNKNMTYCRGHGISHDYLNYLLLQQGQSDTSSFFRNIQTQTTNSAMVDLFFGKTDLIVVPEDEAEVSYQLNEQLRNELVIMKRSQPLLYQIGGVRKDFSTDILTTLTPTFTDSDLSPRVKKVLQKFGVNKIFTLKDDDYQEAKQINLEYQTLMDKTR